MRKSLWAVVVLIMVLVSAVVGASTDAEAGKAELLALHQRDIEAHLQGDVAWLAGRSSDSFFSVDRGEVSFPTAGEREAMFRSYLGATSFTEYRDLREPLVRVSADGSLAWMAVQVKVAGVQRDASGAERPLEFVSAWVMLYEKRGGEWVRAGVASTFKP